MESDGSDQFGRLMSFALRSGIQPSINQNHEQCSLIGNERTKFKFPTRVPFNSRNLIIKLLKNIFKKNNLNDHKKVSIQS